MNVEYLLWLLVPYILLCTWVCIMQFRKGEIFYKCWLATTLALWALSYVDYYTNELHPPANKIATVEYIMRDVQYGWLIRYAAGLRQAPITAALLAGSCWMIAWLIVRVRKRDMQEIVRD